MSIFDADLQPSTFIYYAVRPAFGLVFNLHQGVGWLLLLSAAAIAAGALLFRDVPQLRPARSALSVGGALAFTFLLAQQMALIDARAISRGGGIRIQFVTMTAPPSDDAAAEEATQTALTENEAAPVPVELAQDYIPADLLHANEHHELRLVWRAQTDLVLARSYPQAFCVCSAGDGDDNENTDRRPFNCQQGNARDMTQMSETYFIPLGKVGIERTYLFNAWDSLSDTWIGDTRWSRACDAS